MDQVQENWLMAEVRAAAEAHVLPRFRSLGRGEVRSKTAPDDLVTEADLACEAALTKAIARKWPEAVVIGEEAVAADPSLLDRIGEAAMAVIIDPVDGTWNFANGLAVFGVIVAVTHFGKPVWGGLYDPLLNDWVVARDGHGARFVAAGREARITSGPAKAELSGYLPLFLFPEDMRDRIAAELPGFHRINSLRCSCHEYRMLAQGRVDFVLSAQLKPWDHAAGARVVQEAGGVVRLIDGGAYSAAINEGILLAARDQASWDRVARTFNFLA